MKLVYLYTDGACLGNPGPGGWAAILTLAGTPHRKEICGGYALTTNNRMELLAAVFGLQALKEPCFVEIYTDSQYLSNAISKGWINNWKNRGWQKKGAKPVPNADLWQLLLKQFEAHQVNFNWIKGHAGHPENERCDFLARQSAKSENLAVDTGYESREEHAAMGSRGNSKS